MNAMRSITDKRIEPGSIRAKLEELREFAVGRLTKIRELLAHPENVQKAHEVLAERVGQISLGKKVWRMLFFPFVGQSVCLSDLLSG
jgi:hypothetical protein